MNAALDVAERNGVNALTVIGWDGKPVMVGSQIASLAASDTLSRRRWAFLLQRHGPAAIGRNLESSSLATLATLKIVLRQDSARYISANVAESTKIQADAEKLMSRPGLTGR